MITNFCDNTSTQLFSFCLLYVQPINKNYFINLLYFLLYSATNNILLNQKYGKGNTFIFIYPLVVTSYFNCCKALLVCAFSQEVKGGFNFLASFYDQPFYCEFCLTYYQYISAVHHIRPAFWWRFCFNGCHFLTLVLFIKAVGRVGQRGSPEGCADWFMFVFL